MKCKLNMRFLKMVLRDTLGAMLALFWPAALYALCWVFGYILVSLGIATPTTSDTNSLGYYGGIGVPALFAVVVIGFVVYLMAVFVKNLFSRE